MIEPTFASVAIVHNLSNRAFSMIHHAQVISGRAVLLAVSTVLIAGCQKSTPPASGSATSADETPAVADSGPAQVELISAVGRPVQLDEELRIVELEISYRFLSGAPVKYYLCEIAFLGTERWGVKPFIPNQLKPEGSFTTKIEVGNEPVDKFEMTLSEADSPDQGFHLISNKLEGQLQQPDSDEKGSAGE